MFADPISSINLPVWVEWIILVVAMWGGLRLMDKWFGGRND